MHFCEQCGRALGAGVAFCEGCGARTHEATAGAQSSETSAQPPATSVGPPAPQEAPQASHASAATVAVADRDATPRAAGDTPSKAIPVHAPSAAGASRRPRSWRAIGTGIVLVGVAGVVAGVLLIAGILGGDGTRQDGDFANTAPRAQASALPTLPTHDLADTSATPEPGEWDLAAAVAHLQRPSGSVVLAAHRSPEQRVGPVQWAVYAVPGNDAAGVCRDVATEWLPALQTVMAVNPASDRTGYVQTGAGCSYTFTEATRGDENSGCARTGGPFSWDIAVRSFAVDDPVVRNVSTGSLGTIVPQRVPVYEAPYVEVSTLLTCNPGDVPYADPIGATGDTTERDQPDTSDPARVERLTGEFAKVIDYSGVGRVHSQSGDFAAAERNRRETLRRVNALGRRIESDSPLRDSMSLLRVAARASLNAVLAYQECGAVTCALAENEAASDAKAAFVAEFNRYAHRYLDRTYVATDL